jgi:hypothetical protein
MRACGGAGQNVWGSCICRRRSGSVEAVSGLELSSLPSAHARGVQPGKLWAHGRWRGDQVAGLWNGTS